MMIDRIRYRFLMRRLRGEIARFVTHEAKIPERKEKCKTVRPNACKACGSIV